AEALRTVKRLQWAYGHYSEFGLWHDFADLFADTGIGHYVQGDLNREEIRALFLEQVGHPVTGRPPQYPEGDPAIGRELGFARAGQEAADASAESGFPDRLADSVENSVADGIAGRVVDGAVDGVADSLGSLA